MHIDLALLQKITNTVFEQLKEKEGNHSTIIRDYYWDIEPKKLYNPYEIPSDFTLGQLSDDWQTLQDNFKEADFVDYDLKRVSNLLKVLVDND
jgi:hypothetical protein